MRSSRLSLACALALAFLALLSVHVHADDAEDASYSLVTCGSSMKLLHKQSKYRLHSHPINWGSGSGQQSVTASRNAADTNDLWSVREGFGSSPCLYGEPIRCGSTIRLLHVNTQKMLHSHNHRSPLSGRQEVSAFDSSASNNDDSWIVQCTRSNAVHWERTSPVAFKHTSTGQTLYTRRADAFTQQNCRNCPIVGQLEVSASTSRAAGVDGISGGDENGLWLTEDGVFFPLRDAADDAEYDAAAAATDAAAAAASASSAGKAGAGGAGHLKEEL